MISYLFACWINPYFWSGPFGVYNMNLFFRTIRGYAVVTWQIYSVMQACHVWVPGHGFGPEWSKVCLWLQHMCKWVHTTRTLNVNLTLWSKEAFAGLQKKLAPEKIAGNYWITWKDHFQKNFPEFLACCAWRCLCRTIKYSLSSVSKGSRY